jgi:hypothetical protein
VQDLVRIIINYDERAYLDMGVPSCSRLQLRRFICGLFCASVLPCVVR